MVAFTAASMVPWPLMMTTSGRVSNGQLAQIGQHVETVAIGQPDVEQHHVIRRVFKQNHCFGRGCRLATP